jgi:hypothetical protein
MMTVRSLRLLSQVHAGHLRTWGRVGFNLQYADRRRQ